MATNKARKRVHLDRGDASTPDYALVRTVGALKSNPISLAVRGGLGVLANPFKRDENRTNLAEFYSTERGEWKNDLEEIKFSRKVFTSESIEDFNEDEQYLLRRYATERLNNNGFMTCNFTEVLVAIRTRIHPEPTPEPAVEAKPKTKRRIRIERVVEDTTA